MMKPHLNDKTASTTPMYSRNLIYPSYIVKYWGNTGLWHHSTSQLYYYTCTYPYCRFIDL